MLEVAHPWHSLPVSSSARRSPGPLPEAPGRARPGGAGQARPARTSDGELAARVIEALKAGRSFPDIAVKHRVAPDVLMRLHDQWRQLREADLNAPSVPQEIAGLTRAVVGVHERLDAVEDAVEELTAQMAFLPIIARAPHDCDEGEEGAEETVAFTATCVACREDVPVVLAGRG